MRRIVLVLACVSATARADGYYFTESAGGVTVHDELGAYIHDGARIRISVGARYGRWAIEPFIAGVINGAGENPHSQVTGPPGLTSWGVDLKYANPISKHLELYVRGSASVAEADGDLHGWHGRGLGFGAGIQLKGKVSVWGLLFTPLFFIPTGPKITGALWLDDGYDFYRLHGPKPTAIDAQVSHITLGFALGSDF